MKFPQTFIEEIKQRLRLSEVVGKSISIKKAGREYHALCPFHKENTPSFTVNDEKGFYHCFGCGAHGDVIGFTMEHERLSYPEAIEKLAGIAGMALPKVSEQAVAEDARRMAQYKVVQTCADWFARALAESREGEIARNYLKDRGLKPETVERFGLGYTPADRDILSRIMAEKGVTQAQLIEAGLLIVVEGKAPYSRFRRRLMFPIRDAKGRVIAFGGRILPGEPSEEAAKYVNSPETPLFHKGKQLYNLDNARREAIKTGQLIVAEGYMDVIALSQAGIHHAVAPLGTAITEDQLALIWGMVDEPVLCLDGDNAGLRAMNRAVDLALPRLVPGKSLKIARLPKGEDPDSMLRHLGKAAFDEVITKATPLVDVLWQQAFASPAATPEARAAQEQGLHKKIDQIADAGVKHYYREEMRNRLRARPFEGQNRFHPNAKFAAKPPVPTMPVLPRDSAQSMSDAVTKLLALVLWNPRILRDGDRENAWLSLPLSVSWQAHVHHAIMPFVDDDAGTMVDRLVSVRNEISADAAHFLEKAAAEMVLDDSADHTIRMLASEQLWPELMNDVQCASLQQDIKAAEMALASEMSEEHFSRLAALKHQFEELQRERSVFYRQDPLSSQVS